MGYPNKIVIHCEDEAMRQHFEFVTRRYMAELREWLMRLPRTAANRANIEAELALTEKCLAEAKNAGT